MRQNSPRNQKYDPDRHAALQVLKEVNQDKRFANISLKEILRNRSLTGRDAAFVTQLVYGTLEKQITIDYLLGKLADLRRVNPWIVNILRMGAYQILYMDRVPDSAACNEAVKLCIAHGLFALKGLVNGILRNLARCKEELKIPDPSLPFAENLSIKYSYPLWLVEKWIKDFGKETAEDILKPIGANNITTIRVHSSNTKDRLKELLRPHGMEVQDGFHLSEALCLSNIGDIESNIYYQKGFFTVQGESSILVSHIVDPKSGETVLDACSSPGGKAIHMAELMNGQGRVAAWDIHPHRVDLIERNRKRMGAEIVQPLVMDAAIENAEWMNKFDRILIDAPCSGLGIIHKKPDIKLRLTPNDLKGLPEIQAKILSACSLYLKPGGVLVYSTCTINPEENHDIVAGFLRNHPDFLLEDPLSFMPDTLHTAVQNRMVQIIPSRHRIDGFFIARLRRTS